MPSVRDIKLDGEISQADAGDVSQDIKRMVRRARATKRGRMYLNKSVERLSKLLNQQTRRLEDVNFEDLINVVNNHEEEAFQAINPFTSFFYSDGLLPGEVSENALMLFVIHRAVEDGHVVLS
jgi:ribosome-binding ATPase YchF (GTP1/OBG family)